MAGNLVQHFMNKLGLDSAKTSIKEHPSQVRPVQPVSQLTPARTARRLLKKSSRVSMHVVRGGAVGVAAAVLALSSSLCCSVRVAACGVARLPSHGSHGSS
jgi:hypothetical protein